MRLGGTILILLIGLAISAAVWALTGGRVALLFLPILFGLPLLWRGRRDGAVPPEQR
jgi:hypothetical protein